MSKQDDAEGPASKNLPVSLKDWDEHLSRVRDSLRNAERSCEHAIELLKAMNALLEGMG